MEEERRKEEEMGGGEEKYAVGGLGVNRIIIRNDVGQGRLKFLLFR